MNETIFTIAHPLVLLGEEFEPFGISPLAAATRLKLRMALRPSEDGADRLVLALDGRAVEEARPLWREALAGALGFEPPAGMRVAAVNDAVLPAAWAAEIEHSPAFAVGLVSGTAALAGRMADLTGADIARAGARLMRRLRGLPAGSTRYEAACAACIQGGITLAAVGRSGENFSPLLPDDALLMVWSPNQTPVRDGGGPTRLLADFASNHPDACQALTLDVLLGSGSRAAEGEKAVLYAVLRIREMVEALRESLERAFLDNDVLAEMFDDESNLLVDYAGLHPGPLREARERARRAGALGSSYELFSGSVPVLLVLAPGRRDDVKKAVTAAGFSTLPVAVDGPALTTDQLPSAQDGTAKP